MAPKFDWGQMQIEDAGAAPPSKGAKFDWSQLQEEGVKKVPTDYPGAAQAGLEHFGNAASLGYLPQLQATASLVTPNPSADVDAKLRAQGFKISQPAPSYVSDRDANIRRLQQQSEDHPYASAAGTIGGALAAGAATQAVAPINAATRVGRILQAAKGGALLGAVSNPGDQEGQVADGLQLKDRLSGAATGGALGAAGQGVLEGASAAAKGLSNLPETLQGKAEERAFKSAGAMLKDYRQAAGQDRINELGRYMLDNGLVKPGMSVKDIAEAAESLKGQHGEAIGGILQKLDDVGAAAPSHEELASAIEKQALPLKDLNTAKPTYGALQDLAGDIRTLGKEPPVGVSRGEVGSLTGKGTEYLTDPETGEVMAHFRNGRLVTASGSSPVSAESASAATAVTPKNLSTEMPGSFQGAQDVKKFISDQVEKSGGWKALNPSEKNLALRQAYSTISDQLEQGAGKAAQGSGDQELLKNYLAAKSGYRNAGDIAKIAGDQSLRQNANNFLSAGDKLSGATGAMIGAMSGDNWEDRLKHAAIGAGVGLANKAVRTYGTPLVSTLLDKSGAALARGALPAVGEAVAPVLGSAVRGPLAPAVAESILSRPSLEMSALRSVASSPPKGEDKWAQNGLQNLGINDPDQQQAFLNSPQARKLLIQASDLKPGSKAMKNIYSQIQNLKGAP